MERTCLTGVVSRLLGVACPVVVDRCSLPARFAPQMLGVTCHTCCGKSRENYTWARRSRESFGAVSCGRGKPTSTSELLLWPRENSIVRNRLSMGLLEEVFRPLLYCRAVTSGRVSHVVSATRAATDLSELRSFRRGPFADLRGRDQHCGL